MTVTATTTYDFTDKGWYLAEAIRVKISASATDPCSFDHSTSPFTVQTEAAITQTQLDQVIADFEAGTGYVPIKRDGDYLTMPTPDVRVVQADNEKVIYSRLFPANTLVKGQIISLDMWGEWFEVNANQPYVDLRYRFGATTTLTGAIMNKKTITAVDMTARLYTTNNQDNKDWDIHSIIEVRSLGATGKVLLSGHYWTDLNTQSEYRSVALRSVASPLHTLDTTADRLLEVTVQWSNDGTNHKFDLNTARLQLGV